MTGSALPLRQRHVRPEHGGVSRWPGALPPRGTKASDATRTDCLGSPATDDALGGPCKGSQLSAPAHCLEGHAPKVHLQVQHSQHCSLRSFPAASSKQPCRRIEALRAAHAHVRCMTPHPPPPSHPQNQNKSKKNEKNENDGENTPCLVDDAALFSWSSTPAAKASTYWANWGELQRWA